VNAEGGATEGDDDVGTEEGGGRSDGDRRRTDDGGRSSWGTTNDDEGGIDMQDGKTAGEGAETAAGGVANDTVVRLAPYLSSSRTSSVAEAEGRDGN
jgi:hypothetical protein